VFSLSRSLVFFFFFFLYRSFVWVLSLLLLLLLLLLLVCVGRVMSFHAMSRCVVRGVVLWGVRFVRGFVLCWLVLACVVCCVVLCGVVWCLIVRVCVVSSTECDSATASEHVVELESADLAALLGSNLVVSEHLRTAGHLPHVGVSVQEQADRHAVLLRGQAD